MTSVLDDTAVACSAEMAFASVIPGSFLCRSSLTSLSIPGESWEKRRRLYRSPDVRRIQAGPMVMLAQRKKRKTNYSPTIDNRIARFRYDLLDRFECGIELKGTEIKSVRDGKFQLRDSYARVKRGELYLENSHISPYTMAGKYFNHEAKRSRRLLLHRKDIRKLDGKQKEPGLTIVPTKAYFKNGYLKVELALAKGKNVVDKRRTIKEREGERELRRVVKNTVNVY